MPAAESAMHEEVRSLYGEHHGWLQGWLRRKLGDSFAAADLAQDTFVSVITTGTAAGIREPRPFLATIARRLIAHRHRRQVLEQSYLEALAALPQEMAPSPEVQLLAIEALHQVDRVLDSLPPAAKEAFLLAHLEGLSYAQINERWPELAERWRRRDPEFGAPGGETLDQFYARSIATATRLAEAHPGQTIALVSHGGVMDCLYRAAARVALDAPRSWQLGNAAINRLLYTPQGFTLVGWSDSFHLDDDAQGECADVDAPPKPARAVA